MDHARHLAAVFRLHGQTVAAVALGDHRLLEIGAGAAVYHGIKLGPDLVIGLSHGPATWRRPGLASSAISSSERMQRRMAPDTEGRGSSSRNI